MRTQPIFETCPYTGTTYPGGDNLALVSNRKVGLEDRTKKPGVGPIPKAFLRLTAQLRYDMFV